VADNSQSASDGAGLQPLLVAQFCGALNDNFFKVLVSLLAVHSVMAGGGRLFDVILGGVCFVLPFLLFSPLAGSLADRFSKAHVLRAAKAMELVTVLVAANAFAGAHMAALFFCLFLLGVHSAIFSPAKYGILSELVHEDGLSRANGLIEMSTFFGAICGSALGGVAYASPSIAAAVVAIATATGFVATFLVPAAPPGDPNTPVRWNPLECLPIVKKIRESRGLWLAALGIVYFWALAAMYQVNLSLSAKQLSGWTDLRTSFLLAVLGVGIGWGGAFAGRVSEGRVELGLVPIGSGILALSSWLFAASQSSYALSLISVFIMGVSGGFFVIPLSSYFQSLSPDSARGSYVGALNWLTYSGTLFAYSLLALGVEVLALSPSTMFVLVGLSAFAVMIWSCLQMPEMFVRCANWLVTHTLYRLDVRGLENIPKQGGALIICNHVAYVDPPLILAAVRRPVRFLMFRPIYEVPGVHQIAKLARAIPISPESPKKMVQALQEARASIEAGEIVCIFAEGELTRLGHLLNFKKGFERIMQGLDAPIIPAYIDQIWGSIFSHRNGRLFWKLPKQFPYPVTLAFGKPLPAETPSFKVRETIQELSADLAISRTEVYPSLQSSFLHRAKRRFFARCITDSSGHSLSFFGLLVASLCLKRRFERSFSGSKMIGVLLPPSVAGVIANLATAFARKVSVNINFTASTESIEYALTKCDIREIVTSKAFVEKLEFALPPDGSGKNVKLHYVEDLLTGFSFWEKAAWMTAAALIPQQLFMRFILKDRTKRSDLATVIFSSGSTAEPKGVMLSHGNIASNIESLYEVFQLNRRDAVVGSLPFFHSFGFTGTIWLPLLCGIRAVYHPNPTEAAAVGELIQKEKGTLLMSTPTFLLGYIRKCTPEQLKTLRFVIVGAEKLKDRVGEAFKEKFGIMPMEGYGATELAPVAIMNVANYRDTVIEQIGHKPGTVGHPLPGVAVRIVDPSTMTPLPPGTEGLLLVRGPNVMLGYLGNEARTKEVMHDGWYVTGDLAVVGEDGFVTITDRLSRFSKIAGEMVPHGKVEEALQVALGATDAVVAVTGIPDEKKGERLVVLSTAQFDVSEMTKKLSESGLPNLWIPKKENFHTVSALPLLGSGKLDLKAVKKLAQEFSTAPHAE